MFRNNLDEIYKPSDVIKTLVCPIWGLASWTSKRRNEKNDKVYGDAPPAPPPAPGMGVVVIFLLLVILPALLTVCGVIKAFMCGPNQTNPGASGFVWGLLGCVIPLPAIIYLFAGRCVPSVQVHLQDPYLSQ